MDAPPRLAQRLEPGERVLHVARRSPLGVVLGPLPLALPLAAFVLWRTREPLVLLVLASWPVALALVALSVRHGVIAVTDRRLVFVTGPFHRAFPLGRFPRSRVSSWPPWGARTVFFEAAEGWRRPIRMSAVVDAEKLVAAHHEAAAARGLR